MRAGLLILSFLALALSPVFPQAGIGFADAGRLAVDASTELRNEYSAKALREGAWVLGARAYLPRLSISASEDDRVSEIGSDSFIKHYSVNIDQLLWDGGRLSLSRKMERAELDLSGSRLKQMACDIAEAAVSGYRDVLLTRTVLEIREKTLESLTEQLRILQREVELGLVRSTDFFRQALQIAPNAIQADACIWYILMNAMARSPSEAVPLV